MKLITKIELGTIALWCAVIAIAFVLFPSESYSLILRDTTRIIQGAMFLIIASVSFIMMVLLSKRKKSKKNDITRILLSFFLFSLFGAILQGIFSIFEFSERKLQSTLTDSAYIFIASSTLVMCIFILEVFMKGVRENPEVNKIFAFYLIATIICDIAIIANIFFPITEVVLYLGVLIIVFASFWVYWQLYSQANYLKTRLETDIEQRAFGYLSYSGLVFILAMLSIVLYTVMGNYEFRYLTAAAYSVGFVLLFYGFTLPMDKKKN